MCSLWRALRARFGSSKRGFYNIHHGGEGEKSVPEEDEADILEMGNARVFLGLIKQEIYLKLREFQ
jgi:hypothetical protein